MLGTRAGAPLFGLSPDSESAAVGDPEKAVENARRELDALFGIESGQKPESSRGGPSGPDC